MKKSESRYFVYAVLLAFLVIASLIDPSKGSSLKLIERYGQVQTLTRQ